MRPIYKDRSGWLEAFNQLADSGDDDLLLGEDLTDFDEDLTTERNNDEEP